MKKLLLILVIVGLLAGPALAWVYPGSTADNPLITRYITNLYTNTISAISGNAITLAATDTLKLGTTTIKGTDGVGISIGGNISAASGKFNILSVAKDTTLEVALFTRTCTRDTLAFMTGVDSLTCSYIVSPFATRGAITLNPYVAGIVGGKLVIDRPAADTAKYDRYSVTKIKQR